jgi:hypothetical protein
MFTTIVAWAAFTYGSIAIVFAVLDTIFQFTLTETKKFLGYRKNYFTGAMAFILVAWFLSGWFLFG